MRRLIWFTLQLAALVALAVWLAARPGDVTIVWLGYEIKTSAALLASGAFLLLAACLFIYRLLRYLSPARWKMRGDLHKLERGHAKLTEGLVAVASGDAAEAGRKAIAVRKLLGNGTAAKLLQAQAAQLAGDTHAAEELFEELARDPQGAVLGFRGLITAALRAGKWDEADALARRLERIRPETPWLQMVKLELAARRGEWIGAGEALKQAMLNRSLPRDEARQRQAALLTAEAQELTRKGAHEAALQAAEKAAHMRPRWLPAVIELARAQIEGGHERAARHTIERGWRETPHPALARLYKQLQDNGDALGRLKKFENLARHNIAHSESRIACAEAAIGARLWGEARRHLLALTSAAVGDRRAFRLMAVIEQEEHRDHAAAARWLTRAAEAPVEAQWLCTACGGASVQWQASCAHCGDFATLEWRAPGQSRYAGGGKPQKLTTTGQA